MKENLLIALILPITVLGAFLLYSCIDLTEPVEEMRELELSNYPTAFKQDTLIVIGREASELERESADLIEENLRRTVGVEPVIKRDEEISKSGKSSNLIIVGIPFSNDLLQEIYAITDVEEVTSGYPDKNKAILQILENPWNSEKTLLVVAGSDKWGVRAASEMLTESDIIGNLGAEMVEFEGVEINGKIVYFHQRMIDSAIVESDYVRYEFDKSTAELIEGNAHWRDGLPEHLPSIIPREQAESMVKGEIQFTHLYIIAPDSFVFPIKPTPKNPCWIVRSIDKSNTIVTIIDAVNGEILGYGVPPPTAM